MKTITPFELQMLIDKRDVELIDVRPKERVQEGPCVGGALDSLVRIRTSFGAFPSQIG